MNKNSKQYDPEDRTLEFVSDFEIRASGLFELFEHSFPPGFGDKVYNGFEQVFDFMEDTRGEIFLGGGIKGPIDSPGFA